MSLLFCVWADQEDQDKDKDKDKEKEKDQGKDEGQDTKKDDYHEQAEDQPPNEFQDKDKSQDQVQDLCQDQDNNLDLDQGQEQDDNLGQAEYQDLELDFNRIQGQNQDKDLIESQDHNLDLNPGQGQDQDFNQGYDQDQEKEKNQHEENNLIEVTDNPKTTLEKEEDKNLKDDLTKKNTPNATMNPTLKSIPLPHRTKPLIGPRSAIKRIKDLEAEKEREYIKEHGPILFNTLRDPDLVSDNEDGKDDKDCPKYFYFSGIQEYSDSESPSSSEEGDTEMDEEEPKEEEKASEKLEEKPSLIPEPVLTRRKPSERKIKIPCRLVADDNSHTVKAKSICENENENDIENTQETRDTQDLNDILPALGLRPKRQSVLPKKIKNTPVAKRLSKKKSRGNGSKRSVKSSESEQCSSNSSRRNSGEGTQFQTCSPNFGSINHGNTSRPSSSLDTDPVSGPPHRRVTLNRRAKPHTFSQIYDMDPESPFLYTSERRKGPQVSMEMDEDDDYSPGAQEDLESEEEVVKKKDLAVKIKIEPNDENDFDAKPSKKRKSAPAKETFGFGISLGSVFSLAENSVRTRNMSAAEPVIIKTETEDDWVEPLFIDYPDTFEMDPLGDPLELRPKPAKIKKLFVWPKLDPLFRTSLEYRLPKEFDVYIKALAKPTAEISPIPKSISGSLEYDFSKFPLRFSNSSISISRTSEQPRQLFKPSSTEIKKPSEPEPSNGLRRSGRKRKGKYELRKILGDSPTQLYAEELVGTSSPSKASSTKTSPILSSLSETISRISGSTSVTITPIRENVSSQRIPLTKENVSSQRITLTKEKDVHLIPGSPISSSTPSSGSPVSSGGQSSGGVSCLKLKNVPWLPANWKSVMTSLRNLQGKLTTNITFISPEGVKFFSKQAVMKYIQKQEKKSKSEPHPVAINTNDITKFVRSSRRNSKIQPPSSPSKSSSSSKSITPRRKSPEKPSPGRAVPMSSPEKPDNYSILCKPGKYTCPLCYTVFRLNQTYGRHIMEKDCKLIDKSNSARSNGQRMLNSDEKNDEDDDDLQVLKENINRVPPHYIAVIKCTAAEDSFVESSRVAGLKYLARGELQDGGLQHHPISIQEGLEYYHTIAWKENNDNSFFNNLCMQSKISMCSNVKSYENLCKEPLKVALYLERKIRACRQSKGAGAQRTKAWVTKYENFLKLPFHDIFLSLLASRHKVIEYFSEDRVHVMCLNCPEEKCPGCVLPAPAVPRPLGSKIRIPIRVRTKQGYSISIQPNVKRASRPTKLTKCGSCDGCKRPNCGKCGNCADMKKFGGPGIIKKSCLFRKCSSTQLSQTQINRGLSEKIVFTNKNDLVSGLFNPRSSSVNQRKPDGRVFSKTSPAAFPVPLPSTLVKVGQVSALGTGSRSTPGLGDRSTYRGTMYPCTVCRKPFKTRIEMIAHRSETHAKLKKSAPNEDSAPAQSSGSPGEPRKSPRAKPEKPKPELVDEDDLFERDLRAAITQSQRESMKAQPGESSSTSDLFDVLL